MHLRDFARSGHPRTLAMAFLYFDVSFMVWVLLGVLGVFIARDFGLTASQKGLLVAFPVLGGALVRLPMGILADRFGAKRTGILGQIVVLLPLAWGWLGGGSFGQVMALGLLLGVAGGSFAVALPLASRWYPPRHQGLALGIAGAGNSGTVVTALLAPRLAEAWGWHAVFGLAMIPAALTLLLFALLAREHPRRPAPRPLRAYLDLWRRPETIRFCLLYGFTFGGFVGLASSLLLFFHDQYGVAKVAAGNLTALCVFSGSFMRPLGGYLADRVGGIRMLAALLAAAAGVFGFLAFLPPLGVAVPALFAAMALLGLGNGSVFQLVPQRFRDEIGVATGTIGAVGGLGGFLLPSALGLMRDWVGTYGAGFLCLSLAGGACLAVLATLRVRRAAAPLAGASAPESAS
jgi:NNP family nitrate/nitrite transporter-like MFS transporter